MNILVCIKQVPGSSNVEVDPVTGVLKRDGVASKMNPYDLYGLEAAMALVEKFMEEGHKFIMTTSNLYIKNCEVDGLEFVRRHNPDFSCLAGMITTTWSNVCEEKEPVIMESIELLGKARKQYNL